MPTLITSIEALGKPILERAYLVALSESKDPGKCRGLYRSQAALLNVRDFFSRNRE